jgi:hypothetical protein
MTSKKIKRLENEEMLNMIRLTNPKQIAEDILFVDKTKIKIKIKMKNWEFINSLLICFILIIFMVELQDNNNINIVMGTIFTLVLVLSTVTKSIFKEIIE